MVYIFRVVMEVWKTKTLAVVIVGLVTAVCQQEQGIHRLEMVLVMVQEPRKLLRVQVLALMAPMVW